MSRFMPLAAVASVLVLTVALVRVGALRHVRQTEQVRIALQSAPGQCSSDSNCSYQVPLLLRAGADANGHVSNGNSFLLFAAHRRDAQLMRWLEMYGARPDARVRGEQLCLTANGGTTAQVQALLDAGAPINTRASDGRSALEVAVRGNQQNGIEMALFLLKQGADAKQKSNSGDGLVPLALLYGGDLKLIAALQKAGAPTSRASALAIAARQNNMEEAKRLLAAGVPVDERASRTDWTALQWAASDGHPEMCALLLEHGADVLLRSKGDNNQTALQLANEGHINATGARIKPYERTIHLLQRAEKRAKAK